MCGRVTTSAGPTRVSFDVAASRGAVARIGEGTLRRRLRSGAVEVRVLGPVQVVDGDHVIEIGPKERLVLARLVASARPGRV